MSKRKVYFACSIRGGGERSNYQAIVDAIHESGATCLSEIFLNDSLNLNGSELPEAEIYKRDIAWIRECDAVIAEVSNPSLGVGYEIAFAENLNKPILALWDSKQSKKLSAMIAGSSSIVVSEYTTPAAVTTSINSFLSNLGS